MVGLFPDGGSREGELIGLGGREDGLGEFLVGCVLEGQSGVAEAFEVSLEVGGEDVESVEGDDAVGGDEQEALDLEVAETLGDFVVGVAGCLGVDFASLGDLGEQDRRVREDRAEDDHAGAPMSCRRAAMTAVSSSGMTVRGSRMRRS